MRRPASRHPRSTSCSRASRTPRSALALGHLREEERLVVECRYLLELSEAETAAALGVPAGTVKSRLHRGLARLREELDGVGPLAEVSP